MKNIFVAMAGLAFCLTLVSASGNASPPSLTSFQQSYQHKETTKTFTGTVMKQGDLYVLSDNAAKTNYQLDDATKASKYEGKTVKVTGTLDAQNLTIHVQTITEVS
jgi:lipopolysaccharide export system protein LptA